jgi:GT2 family glycosyltransferase
MIVSQNQEEKVSIIVVNYNAYDLTLQCLESLSKLDYDNFSLVLVDNASANEEGVQLKKWCKENISFAYQLILSDKNLGFAGGNNLALEYLQEQSVLDPWVWLLNNDTIVSPDSLTQMVTHAQSSETHIIGSRLVRPDGSLQTLGGGVINRFTGSSRYVLNADDFTQMNYIVGASMLLRSEVIKRCGLLSEDYFLYYEEGDYCLKAQAEGFRLACADASVVEHHEGGVTGAGQKAGSVPEFSDCLLVRNRMQLASRYKFNFLGRYLGFAVSLINRMRRRQWRRIGIIVKITFNIQAFHQYVKNNGGDFR